MSLSLAKNKGGFFKFVLKKIHEAWERVKAYLFFKGKTEPLGEGESNNKSVSGITPEDELRFRQLPEQSYLQQAKSSHEQSTYRSGPLTLRGIRR